jgi:hypothetical protein
MIFIAMAAPSAASFEPRAIPCAGLFELLRDLPPDERLTPFHELEHEFATPEEVCAWLEIAGDRDPTCIVD